METTTLPRRYSDLEKQELIEQWKQSGKNKAAFCKEMEIGYYSFNDWLKKRKNPVSLTHRKPGRPKSSFVPLKVKHAEEKLTAQLILKSGTRINIYQSLDSGLLAALFKA